MQENLFFWRAWEKPFRAFYLALLVLLGLCILTLGVSYFAGDAITIGWTPDTEVETTAVTTDQTTVDFFNFNLETNLYITRSWIDNGNVKLYPAAAYVYLIVVTLTILVLITIFTFLDLIYFLIGLTTIIVFIVSLNTELLSFFGWQHKGLSVLLILVYGGVSYWFHGYANFSFTKRFVFFTAITALRTSVRLSTSLRCLLHKTEKEVYCISASSLSCTLVMPCCCLGKTNTSTIRISS